MTLDVRARPIGLRTRQSRPEVVSPTRGRAPDVGGRAQAPGIVRRGMPGRRLPPTSDPRSFSCQKPTTRSSPRGAPAHVVTPTLPVGCEPSGAHPYTGCRARPFCVSSVNSRGVDLSAALSERGDLSREIRLQGSNGVEFRMLLCDPSSNVGLGPVVGSQTSHGDNAQCAVGCAISERD
jgi:hypothetical protein